MKRTVRRLRRISKRETKRQELQLEFLMLMNQLESPAQVMQAPPPQLESPTPMPTMAPPELEVPPPLTPKEIEELRELPMPDPVEEIEYRLGLSTTPPSPQTSAG